VRNSSVTVKKHGGIEWRKARRLLTTRKPGYPVGSRLLTFSGGSADVWRLPPWSKPPAYTIRHARREMQSLRRDRVKGWIMAHLSHLGYHWRLPLLTSFALLRARGRAATRSTSTTWSKSDPAKPTVTSGGTYRNYLTAWGSSMPRGSNSSHLHQCWANRASSGLLPDPRSRLMKWPFNPSKIHCFWLPESSRGGLLRDRLKSRLVL
jgi:hypothetical protein